GMIEHAAQFAAAGIPFIFDPGQGMPLFNGKELLQLVDQASWITVNDYEAQVMQERTGEKIETLARRARQGGARPDGLRRRLSRRSAVRPDKSTRLGNDGPHRVAHQLDQSRAHRDAESSADARGILGIVPREFRLRSVALIIKVRCPRRR